MPIVQYPSHRTRPILACVLSLTILLFVWSGCTRDELVLLEPELTVPTEYNGGTWRRMSAFACGVRIRALAAWSTDDVLVSGDYGTILRVRDGEITNLGFPSPLSVVSLACAPGGVAYAADETGTIHRWAGAGWIVDMPTSTARINGMHCDDTGIVTAVGELGMYFRREGGSWTEGRVNIRSDLTDIWGLSRNDLWVAGHEGVVAHFNGTDWEITTPIGDDYHFSDVAGNERGQLAFLDPSRDVLYFDGAGWRHIKSNRHLRCVSFVDGQLVGLDGVGMFIWNGQDWLATWFLPQRGGELVLNGDGRLLVAGGGGALDLLEDDSWITLAPYLGGYTGFAVAPDGIYAATENGWILRHDDQGWEMEIDLGEDADTGGYSLACDDRGRVLALTEDGVWRREAEGWERIEQFGNSERYRGIFGLADGSLCLDAGDEIRALVEDEAIRLFRVPDDWGRLVALAGPSLSEVWLLTERWLGLFDGIVVQPVLSMLQGMPEGLAYDPERGLLYSGREGLFLVYPDGTSVDLTPVFQGALDPRRVVFEHFAVAAPGIWYGRDRLNRLLRCYLGEWEVLNGQNSFLGLLNIDIWPAPGLVVGTPRDIYLVGHSQVAAYHDSARAWMTHR